MIATYYRVHEVVDINENEEFINYYHKTNSRLKVSQMFLDFITERSSPNVRGWTKNNRKF